MGRNRKPDHPLHMMSDVVHKRTLVHKRTSITPPSEEASHRPPSERPLVPPPSNQPPQRPLLVAPPLEEASQQPPSEGPLVPPHRPLSVAPQQLSITQPLRLPSVRPPLVAPQQLSSQLESSSSQPITGHVSSSLASIRHGRGCAKGIKEWGTGTKLDIQFDENHCPIGDNVSKLTTQLGIIVRNGNIVPLTFLDWITVPDDIIDAIWKDVKDNLNVCPEEYKPICMKTCNNISKDHKNKIKTKYFKPRSSDPNLKDVVPLHIVPSQWEEHGEYWRTSDAEKITTRNAKNRRAPDIPHTTGRTTFAQIWHEAPDASSGHRVFRKSAGDETPYTPPPPEDQIFPSRSFASCGMHVCEECG